MSHLFFADDLILLAEARMDQVDCIKEGLALFCKDLDHRVNFNKSLMFISASVD